MTPGDEMKLWTNGEQNWWNVGWTHEALVPVSSTDDVDVNKNVNDESIAREASDIFFFSFFPFLF